MMYNFLKKFSFSHQLNCNIIRHCVASKVAFSFVEILFVILIVGIISVSLLKALQSLKKQDYRIQYFLVNNASLFETQLFINKHISLAKIDSIVTGKDMLHYESFDKMFMPAKNDKFMDFSLQTVQHAFSFVNGNLYFDNSLLLGGVSVFESNLHKGADSILSYKLCLKNGNECINETLFLEDTEVFYQ